MTKDWALLMFLGILLNTAALVAQYPGEALVAWLAALVCYALALREAWRKQRRD